MSHLKIRNIIQFAFFLLLLAGLPSCNIDPGFAPEEMASATLRLSTRSSVTRSDGKDELEADPYDEKEDKIGRIHLFFYTAENSTSAPFFVTELDVNVNTSANVTVGIPEVLLTSEHFPGDKAYVYALVNLPAGVTVDAASTTLAELQTLWVDNPGFVSASAPETFVMRGGGEVTLQSDGTGAKTASGTILLERLAAKMRVWADIPAYLYIDKETGKTIKETDPDFSTKQTQGKIEKWASVPASETGSNVNLYLYNLTQRGRIDGYVGECVDEPEAPEDLAYAHIDNATKGARKLSKDAQLKEADKDAAYGYSHATAYYSYPNAWDGESPSEQHRTHVVISVPWERVEGGEKEYRECYYSVPVNALTAATDKAGTPDCLEPNCYYRIKVRIAMLGNTNRGEASEIPASYEVVPWTTENVDVNIKDRRYLVVNQTNWVMNNTHTLEIPFATSHKTEVVACYVNYFRYHDAWGEDANANALSAEGVPGRSDTRNEGLRSIDYLDYEIHNKKEFGNWLKVAETSVANGGLGGKANEGEISTSVNGYNTMLYYKKKYFYDDIYNDYKYYVGHEQPKTFQHDHITFEESVTNGLGGNNDDLDAWKQYNEKYDNINAIYTCGIDHDRSVISFSHPLVQWKEVFKDGKLYYAPELNPRTGKLWDEFSRIEIIIKIKHADWKKNDGLYEETIYITQFPGIYVEVSHNYGSIGKNEYVIVNNNKGKTTRWDEVNTLGTFQGSNNNPNMYVIHVSKLSDEDEHIYEIGDPRTLYFNNYLFRPNPDIREETGRNDPEHHSNYPKWLNAELVDSPDNENVTVTSWSGINNTSWDMQMRWQQGLWNQGSWTTPSNRWNNWKNSHLTYNNANASYDNIQIAFDKNQNRLLTYYPTDETSGSGTKENFIAPVFRIASSFGKVVPLGRTEARRRCATYQEAGRPAGRWRLPTMAEIRFVAQLSADHKIPVLFGAAFRQQYFDYDWPGYYWSANGSLTVDDEGNVLMDEKGDGGVRVTDEILQREGKTMDDIRIYPHGTFAARCVYDEWYWTKIDGGEFPVKPGTEERLTPRTTDFYWGDVKKDNTQVLPKN